MKDITQHTNTKTVGSESCLSAQEKKSFSEHGKVTRCLSGGSSKTILDKQGSTVQCSETSLSISVPLSFVRRMLLLTRSGLVRGTILLSQRKRSGQLTLDAVLKSQDGESAEELK